MCATTKKPAILSLGLAALVTGLLLEIFLQPSGKFGHFATGFFLGIAIVLLLTGSFRLRVSLRS